MLLLFQRGTLCSICPYSLEFAIQPLPYSSCPARRHIFSAKEEELSVRGIFAVNQEKVLDDYLVSTGDADEEEIEEEYNQKCMQVVSGWQLLCWMTRLRFCSLYL